MELLVTKEAVLCLEENKIAVEDLYDDAFYKYSDEHAVEYNNDTYVVNEQYYALIQKYLVLKLFVENNSIDCINVKDAPLYDKLIFCDIAKEKNIPIKGYSLWSVIKLIIGFHVLHLSSFLYLFYLMVRIPHKDVINNKESAFTVLREKAAISKFKNINIPKEIENPWDKESIYRLFPRFQRMGWVINSYIHSFKSMRKIRLIYKEYTGVNCQYIPMDFYRKRIVHSELYGYLMDSYFQHFKGKTYYTGSNLDRFSVIEEKLAQKYGINTVCYPHGLEYGFKFPKGFSCEVFYATTEYAAKYLNELYGTKKFVFDESVISLMYKLPQKSTLIQGHKKIVFFTEPREVEVNIHILENLIPILKKDGLNLYVKLHPGDNKGNYAGMDVTFLTDYVEAMTNVICVARKSTVLLEALYNDSTPIAILTNQKDITIYKTLPSLSSDKIIQTYSVEELVNAIKEFV